MQDYSNVDDLWAALPYEVQICNFKKDETDCDKDTRSYTGYIVRIGKDSPQAKDVTKIYDAYKAGDQLEDKSDPLVDHRLKLVAGAIFGEQVEQAVILDLIPESNLVENGTPLNQHGPIELISRVTLADTTAYDPGSGVIPTLVKQVPVDALAG